MYPLTHLYVTEQVLGSLNPALALGSILPDILVGAGLTWKEAHNHSFKKLPDTNRDLMLGDLIHGSFLPGLDYYSDCAYEDKEGYAFQNAVHLCTDLVRLGIPQEHALWRGHNFIEMAIETMLNETNSYLWCELEKAFHQQELKSEVYSIIAGCNLHKPGIVDLILQRFLEIRGKKECLAADYARKLNNIYRLGLSAEKCLALIAKSQELITPHFRKFLNNCVDWIAKDLKNGSA
jgi:hypothetical protein